MIVFILLLVLGVFMMLPLIYSIVTSFKPIEELFVFPPRFFVTQPTLSNYKSLFNIVVMALLFNTTVLWIPQYFIMSKLHIINTYLVYILPVLPLPIGLFLMKQFMANVPNELVESAKIDGAGIFRVFWSVVMPQVKPAWMTLVVFAFQTVWNQQPLNMVFNEELKLINMIMSQITAGGMARMGASMAAGVIIMVPPLLVFIFTQNNIIETMTSSGIKG